MIKKGQIQDAEGNIVYWHTSSDVVFDEETGNTVKEDIDTIKSALGMKSGSSVSVNIDANTLQGHDSSYFASNDTVESKYLKKEYAATIYLTSTDAADKYLTKTDAGKTYLKSSDATSTYLTKTDAGNTYATKTALNSYLTTSSASSTYLTKTDAGNTYATKTELSNKIRYGTSVPSSLAEGQVYLVYE